MAWKARKPSRGAQMVGSFGGAAMLFLFGWAFQFRAGGPRYRRTEGTVIESRVKESEIVRDGVRGTRHLPLIRCRYEVGGKAVENRHCRSKAIDWFVERADAEKVVARYPLGRKCTVYYDAEKPATSRLDPEPRTAGGRAPGSIAILLYLWGGWALLQGLAIAAAPGLVYWYVRRREGPGRQRVGHRSRGGIVQDFWRKHAPALAAFKFVYGGFMFTAMGSSLYLGLWLGGAGKTGYKFISIWAAPFIAFGLGCFVYAFIKYRALSPGRDEPPGREAPRVRAAAVGEIPEFKEEPAEKPTRSFPMEYTCPRCGRSFTIKRSGRYKCRCGAAFSL